MSDTDQSIAQLELAPRLDTDVAPELKDDLIALRGASLQLVAHEVGYIGARCLAVLVAAANTWKDDGYSLTISNPTEAMVSGLARMGATVDLISFEGGAA